MGHQRLHTVLKEIVHELWISSQKAIKESVSSSLTLATQVCLFCLVFGVHHLSHGQDVALIVVVLVKHRWKEEPGEDLVNQSSLLVATLACFGVICSLILVFLGVIEDLSGQQDETEEEAGGLLEIFCFCGRLLAFESSLLCLLVLLTDPFDDCGEECLRIDDLSASSCTLRTEMPFGGHLQEMLVE